ncbi:MAG: hypothetical protein GT601_18240 [Acidaminobacter sp.]|uniref:hypothetical protein n=1 Tax=Acidaminobacter sp. TaxID=1872102 RepID=UPI0013852607|nr:hypothetical protein [Acidaminobacter sp.]MZQ99612.1 hypothetical protein [Acidaminobacter sp.]
MKSARKNIVVILILVITTSLFLSSCGSKKEESPSPTAQPEQTEQQLPEPKPEESPQISETEMDGSFQNWQPFNVEPGQYFKYKTKITQSDGQIKEGWFTLKVEGENDDQVTIESEGESGEDKFSFTTTESKDNVFGSVMMSYMMNPASQHVFTTIYSPFMGGGMWMMGISQGSIKAGNKWSYTADGKTISNEVVEMREYAGVKGYFMRYLVDDEIQSEVCLSTEFPLALMSYVKMDDAIYESELVEYEEDR